MNRRRFSKLFGAFSGLFFIRPVLNAGVETVKENYKLLMEVPIAGTQFYDTNKVWHLLKPGSKLTLKREADNYYDSKAIEIYFDQYKLGYIPRVSNTPASQLMDRRETIFATLKEKTIDPNPWNKLKIEVWLKV